MEKKLDLRIGFLILLAFIGLGILFSASRPAASSATKPASQSPNECCKNEKDPDASGSFEFESLPGKFFSVVFIN